MSLFSHGRFFDVVAVDLDTGGCRLVAGHKTETSADAIIRMAIATHQCEVEKEEGVEHEFFQREPVG
jgi:hypothetical protein